MKYLVLEVHPAYVVVLDEEGRFLKAANQRCQVGDTLEEIVQLRYPDTRRPIHWRRAAVVAAGLAACFCLAFVGYYQPNFTPYGTLRIQINPDVEMTLSGCWSSPALMPTDRRCWKGTITGAKAGSRPPMSCWTGPRKRAFCPRGM